MEGIRVTDTPRDSSQRDELPEDAAKTVSIARQCLNRHESAPRGLKGRSISAQGYPPTAADRIL